MLAQNARQTPGCMATERPCVTNFDKPQSMKRIFPILLTVCSSFAFAIAVAAQQTNAPQKNPAAPATTAAPPPSSGTAGPPATAAVSTPAGAPQAPAATPAPPPSAPAQRSAAELEKLAMPI